MTNETDRASVPMPHGILKFPQKIPVNRVALDAAKEKLESALILATDVHTGQYRSRNNLPYIVHPVGVLNKIAFWGIRLDLNPEIWLAAVLHDTVEDTPVSLQEIEVGYGKEVSDYVEMLTFRRRDTGESREDYEKIKTEHLTAFKEKPLGVHLVKLADRLCNIHDYLRTDPAYAILYANRAEGLIQGILDRQNEFSWSFGEHVISAIMIEIEALSKLLTEVYKQVIGERDSTLASDDYEEDEDPLDNVDDLDDEDPLDDDEEDEEVYDREFDDEDDEE